MSPRAYLPIQHLCDNIETHQEAIARLLKVGSELNDVELAVLRHDRLLVGTLKSNISKANSSKKAKDGQPIELFYATHPLFLPKEMTEGKTCPKCGKNPCQCESVNEEEVLGEGLEGYAEYKEKVKYKVIPFIW